MNLTSAHQRLYDYLKEGNPTLEGAEESLRLTRWTVSVMPGAETTFPYTGRDADTEMVKMSTVAACLRLLVIEYKRCARRLKSAQFSVWVHDEYYSCLGHLNDKAYDLVCDETLAGLGSRQAEGSALVRGARVETLARDTRAGRWFAEDGFIWRAPFGPLAFHNSVVTTIHALDYRIRNVPSDEY